MTANGEQDGRGTPNVVIGANGPAILAGMRMALEADGIAICAEITSVQELVAAVDQCAPDLCLIDVDLEGDGIRGTAEVTARAPDVAVVLLVTDTGEDRFLDAMRAGAAGYVLRSIAPTRLPKVVRAVLSGESAIPRALVVPLINQYRQRSGRRRLSVPRGRGVDLTSREWEVLDLMREGLSTRQIAARLLISEVTVRRHIGSVLKKLDVQSRADALKLLQSA